MFDDGVMKDEKIEKYCDSLFRRIGEEKRIKWSGKKKKNGCTKKIKKRKQAADE